jgi:hypothetical protein
MPKQPLSKIALSIYLEQEILKSPDCAGACVGKVFRIERRTTNWDAELRMRDGSRPAQTCQRAFRHIKASAKMVYDLIDE